MWGVTDADSWVGEGTGTVEQFRNGEQLMFTLDYQPKPAYGTLRAWARRGLDVLRQ